MADSFIPTIDASKLKPSNKYVCWIDTMGTQNIMSESLAKASNYILKLHSCLFQAASELEAIMIYPVMDGAYITCANKKVLTVVLKKAFSSLANIFLQEKDNGKRFVVRASLAFGDIIDGNMITEDVTEHIPTDYKQNILLGMPIVQAYKSEKNAPPFGIFIHESARKFDDEHKIQGRTFKWWNQKYSQELCGAICEYFEWCRYNSLLLEMDEKKIDNYIKLAKSYFIPYSIETKDKQTADSLLI